MELEERVESLELTARNALTDNMVMDALLRALIATHPNPSHLKFAFQTILADLESRFSDLGFESGREERIPRGVIAELQKRAGSFLAIFPQ